MKFSFVEDELPNLKENLQIEELQLGIKNNLIFPDSDTLRKFCRDLGFRGKNLRLGYKRHAKLIIEYLKKILKYL